jgi:K+-sensing histidine kinase KdpD
LKTPITAVRGLARVLKQRHNKISAEDRAAALEAIEADAERALIVLDALLNLSAKIRRPSGEVGDIPLHAVLSKVLTAHQRRNPNRKLVVSGDSPIYAKADSMAVELALANLLNNAEKYAPKNTEIDIAAYQEGNRVTMLVANEGPTLKPEQYEKLWDIYSMGPDPGVEVSGSGIGLALCKELVQTMGGRVWAGPNRPGGSVFAVTLPTSGDMSVPSRMAA